MFHTKFHKEDISNYSFLVTGGAGFIGSNIVEYLLKYNAKRVVILDNFATGHYKNINSFINQSNCELLEGDIRDLGTCYQAVKGIDYIFHQAALGSVPRSIEDPSTTNNVNITGFLNMLIVLKDSSVKRMIYAASSSTYGDSKALPKVESSIGNPLSPYAVTKYVNELYADVFAKVYGVELIGLRYFNVFGQRQDPSGAYAAVIPKFASGILKKEKIVINGDGEHSRDFTYIENVVQANLLSAFAPKNAVNQVYNVAYGENTNLNELFEILKELFSKYDDEFRNAVAIHGPERRGDVKHSLADITKARKLLGYEPEFDIFRGLTNSVQWYWDNKDQLINYSDQ